METVLHAQIILAVAWAAWVFGPLLVRGQA